jgi:hypothetical protein
MNIIKGLLLGTALFFSNADVSDITSDVESSEVVEEVIENEDASQFEELIDKWVNGEFQLDESTTERITNKLIPVVQQNLDGILKNFVEEDEERTKLSAVLSAVLVGLISLGIQLLMHKGFKKANNIANNNNAVLAQQNKEFKGVANEIKESTTNIEGNVEKLQVDLNNQIEQLKTTNNAIIEENAKLREQMLENEKLHAEQLKGIMGILQITYPNKK